VFLLKDIIEAYIYKYTHVGVGDGHMSSRSYQPEHPWVGTNGGRSFAMQLADMLYPSCRVMLGVTPCIKDRHSVAAVSREQIGKWKEKRNGVAKTLMQPAYALL
jgi:hypothetical protein